MHKRSSIIGGLILISVGVFFLLIQTFPALASIFNPALYWPLIILAVGGFFLLGAVLGNAPLAVPGAIISGIGLLLTYQNFSGNWGSWAYAWALIPGFVGIGLIIMALLDKEQAQETRAGYILILISFVLFIFFGGFLGGLEILGNWWPLLLIVAGVFLLIRRGKNQKDSSE